MQRRQLLRLSGAGVLCTPTILRSARAASAAPEPVDVELILAVDVSRSIDAEEHETQMRGYAAAFRDPEVIRSIKGGGIGAISCTLFTWSDSDSQEDLVPWMRIGDEESAERFAAAIDAAPRRTWSYTSISGAMEHSLQLYAQGRFEGTRRVLDISGDGMNNSGRRLETVRSRMLEEGIVTNGLAVLDRAPGPGNGAAALEDYYREEVIGGPGAFLVVAEGFDAFDRAVRRKIAREIAGIECGPRFAGMPVVDRVSA
ncbi:DUF1194 domain-containing protein [Pararoseomonas indoligenes]|uniref:DUF1194 domain-containing protein n=1 Tax=Roseomonas indoligenes TaxID=2820811 RepID=A0A940MV96_9PROT|nr:DUF1194 domain-containing protein [Pararoseomonas indoligenes]MBP0491394.1 DUF1194 domain-containing protein [Pararoseomonas indoligenes]